MPKWMKLSLMVFAMLVSLLMLMSCGSGDKMPVSRTDPLEMVTGETGGAGGGGPTGACEWTVILLNNPTTGCYQGFNNSMCSALTKDGGTVVFTPNATCESLGYTCNPQAVGGVNVCI